jgi:hypothetical protein
MPFGELPLLPGAKRGGSYCIVTHAAPRCRSLSCVQPLVAVNQIAVIVTEKIKGLTRLRERS